MDWNILPLQIILLLQGLAVIGVSLMLIADSYRGRSEFGEGRSTHRHSWRRHRVSKPSAAPDPDPRG